MTAAARVAIVDYGVGNLFSVRQALLHAGLDAEISADRRAIAGAHGIVLPGIGAFGDAMDALRSLDLVDVLRGAAADGTPLIGVCLGEQLLMSESEEFGRHEGLGIVPGTVRRFPTGMRGEGRRNPLKVPQVGWNTLRPPSGRSWSATALDGLGSGDHVYFVHSFHVIPDDPAVVLSETTYGDITYASAIAAANVTAFQFHPERSGAVGLRIYENLATSIKSAAGVGAP